jgi:hypothetical protein
MTHTTQVGRNVSAALALLAISAWFGTARADGVALNRYGASETVEDGFCVSRPDDRGNAKLDTVLHLEYANDPLVLELEQGDADSEAASVVSDQLSAHLSLSLGMWNQVVFFAGLSGNLLMSGEQYVDPVSLTTVNTADGPGLGDVRLGARARLLGRSKDLVLLIPPPSSVRTVSAVGLAAATATRRGILEGTAASRTTRQPPQCRIQQQLADRAQRVRSVPLRPQRHVPRVVGPKLRLPGRAPRVARRSAGRVHRGEKRRLFP